MRKGKVKFLISGPIIIAILLSSLFSFVPLCSAEGDLALDYLYELCESYYKSGSYEKALEYAKMILLINPADKKARGWVTLIEQAKQLSGAKKAQLPIPLAKKKAVLEREKKLKAKEHYIQGLRYYKLHQYEQAIAEFQATLELNPKFSKSYKYIEKCKIALSKTEERRIKSKEKELKEKAEQLKIKEKNLKEEEIKTKQIALEEEPKEEVKALYQRAKDYYQKQQYGEAIAEFKKVLELNPGHTLANKYIELARKERQQAKEKELRAQKEAEKRARQEKEAEKEKQAKEYYLKGKEYYREHGYEQAIAEFQKALDLIPDYPDVHKYLERAKGMLLEAKQKQLEDKEIELKERKTAFEKAEKKMQAQYKQDAESLVKYHYNRALSYDRSQRYKEAVEEYKKVLQITPTDADTHYNLAVIYDEELEDYQKAVEHYRKYLEFRPNAEDAEAVKGWIFQAERTLEFERKLK